MRERKSFLALAVLVLAFAFISLAGATVLANIKMTATFYNYTDGTTYNADFHLKVIDKANDGFDNTDFVLQKLPSGGGYAVIYSNTTDGYSLAIDSYNGTSSRKIKLVYSIVPSNTGVVNLTWHVSGKKFKAKLKDYANDNTYTTSIAAMDMMTASAYSAQQSYSDGLRYFGIESDNNQIPVFFVYPTNVSGTILTGDSYPLRINMTNASGLGDFVFNWNGTNYSIYDSSSLVFMVNFDNVSALGENDTNPADLSYYENSITNNGATWIAAGKYHGDYQFDGNSDYLSIPNTNPHIGDEFTFASWVYIGGACKDGLCGLFTNLNGHANARALIGSGGNIGTQQLAIGSSYGQCGDWVGNGPIDSNKWHYVVIEGNLTSQQIYVDNFLLYSCQLPIQSWSGTNPLYLGRGESSAVQYMLNGSIDEVRIWNRSLSAEEVNQIYYSNLQKTADDKWSFYSNQSNLLSGIYNYQAFANDYYNGWNSTEIRNITIQSAGIVAFSIINGVVDFGNLSARQNAVNLSGFIIQNDGTAYLNIEVNATSLWKSSTYSYPGKYWFRAGDAGEGNESSGVYNSSSALDWMLFDVNSKYAIQHFNYALDKNLAALQINITVPSDEPSGLKESTIIITASAS